MFRITRTSHLQALRADLDDALATEQTLRATVADSTSRATVIAEEAEMLRAELDRRTTDWSDTIHQTRAELDQAHAELEAARAQVLLDAEDRVALRALLRTARRQDARADRVYLLYRHGTLHSIHTSLSAAEEAAEAEGAARSGWTASAAASTPGEAEAPWLICPQRVSGQ